MNSYKDFINEIANHRKWLKFSGLVLFLNSLIGLSAFSHNVIYISSLSLFLSGLIYLLHARKFWTDKLMGYYLHISSGFLYMFVALLNQRPINNLFALIIILALSYIMAGLFRVVITILNSQYIMQWILTGITGSYNIFIAAYLLKMAKVVSYDLLLALMLGDSLLTGLALMSLAYVANSSKLNH